MNHSTRRPVSLDNVALTPKQALALRIHARFGTTKMVAEVLGIAPENASRLLTRARAKGARLARLQELVGDANPAPNLAQGSRRQVR